MPILCHHDILYAINSRFFMIMIMMLMVMNVAIPPAHWPMLKWNDMEQPWPEDLPEDDETCRLCGPWFGLRYFVWIRFCGMFHYVSISGSLYECDAVGFLGNMFQAL